MIDDEHALLEQHLDFHSYHVDSELPDNEALVERIQSGDKTAEPLLLSRNERFLNSCALDIADQYGVYDLTNDLKQEAALAMLRAARRFDFSKNVKFLTYTWPIVKSAVMDYAAETTIPVRLPPTRYHQIRKVSWILTTTPTGTEEATLIESVMEQMNVSRKVALGLIGEAQRVFDSVQLGDRVDYLSYGGDPAIRYTAQLRHEHISELMAMLKPRERMIIQKYCGFDDPDGVGMTFEEIAVQLNFNSPSAAEKAFRRAISKLSELYGKVGTYGAWRSAEKAFREAKRESTEPAEYSTPQSTWYEKQP